MTKNTFCSIWDQRLGLSFFGPRRQRHRVFNRHGAVVPLIAILLPVFCIFIAFAVDYGVISLSKHQLQNAADAGAVAAIETYFQNTEFGDQAANEVITNSQLLGTNIDFDIGESIEYGRWDADSEMFTLIPRTSTAGKHDTSGTSIPPGANAARVTLLRSPENGNGISLFFAPIFGTDFATVTARGIASAAAT